MVRGDPSCRLTWAALGLGVGGNTAVGLWINAFNVCNNGNFGTDPCNQGQWSWVVMAVFYTYFAYAAMRLVRPASPRPARNLRRPGAQPEAKRTDVCTPHRSDLPRLRRTTCPASLLPDVPPAFSVGRLP